MYLHFKINYSQQNVIQPCNYPKKKKIAKLFISLYVENIVIYDQHSTLSSSSSSSPPLYRRRLAYFALIVTLLFIGHFAWIGISSSCLVTFWFVNLFKIATRQYIYIYICICSTTVNRASQTLSRNFFVFVDFLCVYVVCVSFKRERLFVYMQALFGAPQQQAKKMSPASGFESLCV